MICFIVTVLKRPAFLVMPLLLIGCATTKTIEETERTNDPELVRLANTAAIAYNQGSIAQSARLYTRALTMARMRDDALEIGNNAYNLGAAMLSMERYDEAEALFAEARREFERLDRETADIILLQAMAARFSDDPQRAVALSEQVIPALKSSPTPAYRMQVALIKTHVGVDVQDAESARSNLADAQKEAEKIRDPLLRAALAGAAGRVLEMEGKHDVAAAEYDKQADLYRNTGKYREMALALGRAGHAHEQAGNMEASMDRFHRSARSLFAQRDDVGALKMVEAALSAAEKSGDPTSIAGMAALFQEIRDSIEVTQDEQKKSD